MEMVSIVYAEWFKTHRYQPVKDHLPSTEPERMRLMATAHFVIDLMGWCIWQREVRGSVLEELKAFGRSGAASGKCTGQVFTGRVPETVRKHPVAHQWSGAQKASLSPFTTLITVRKMILRSSQRFQFSRYHRS